MKHLIIIVFTSLLFSCTQKSIKENTKTIIYFDRIIKVKGTKLIEGLYGINNILKIEKGLVLVASRRENLFYVYSTSGDSIGALGVHGEGPNDLINCHVNGVSNEKEGLNSIWINDVSAARLKLVDIDASLKEKHCVIQKNILSYPMSMNSFYLRDSLLVIEKLEKGDYWIEKYDASQGKVLSSAKEYAEHADNVFSCYKSLWRLKPDATRLASAMYSMNRMHIIDLETDTRLSLSIGNPLSINNVVDKNTGLEYHTYYCDLAVDDAYIYALYMDQPYQESYEKEKQMELHIFDWEGEPLYRVLIPEYIKGITIDSQAKMLYGLLNDEAVYTYDLKNII